MRVLICDDDASIRQYFETLFDLEGWETDLVASGEECLEHFRDGAEPDVVVLDQLMPGLLGLQVAERLRTNGFTRPIVLCSAHIGVEHRMDVARLDLLPVNKIDARAVLRIAMAAMLEDRSGKPTPVQP